MNSLDLTTLLQELQHSIVTRIGRFEEVVSVVINRNLKCALIRLESVEWRRTFVFSLREIETFASFDELYILADEVVKRYQEEKDEILFRK